MIKFKTYLTETVPLSQLKNHLKNVYSDEEHINGREFNKDRWKMFYNKYESWFDGKKRVYIPLESKQIEKFKNELQQALSFEGYTVTNWDTKLVKNNKGGNPQKIGKLLGRLILTDGKDNLYWQTWLKNYNSIMKKETAQDLDYYVVISRSRTDIIQMSADRKYNKDTKETLYDIDKWYKTELKNTPKDKEEQLKYEYEQRKQCLNGGWDSCKNIVNDKGAYHHLGASEIENGALIAYVVEQSDKEIHHPIARLLLSPLFLKNSDGSNVDDVVLYPTGVYGDRIDGFEEIVKKWLEDKQGKVNYKKYEAHEDKIYAGDIQGQVDIKIDKNFLSQLFHQENWAVDNEKAYTYHMDALNSIFNKNYISDYFNFIPSSNYESYENEYNLQESLKNVFEDDDILDKFLEKVGIEKDNDFDLEEFVENLNTYDKEIAYEMANWYGEEKELLENESVVNEIYNFFSQNTSCIRIDLYDKPRLVVLLNETDESSVELYKMIISTGDVELGIKGSLEYLANSYNSLWEMISNEAYNNAETPSKTKLITYIKTEIL